MEQGNPQNSGFHVDSSESWIGVHTLSEFAFCPRAGICSHDLAGSDEGEEFCDRPGFYHLPIFFETEMDLRREETARVRLLAAAFGLLMVLAMLVGGVAAHPVFFAAAFAIATVSLVAYFTFEYRIRQIDAALQQWMDANSTLPDPEIADPIVVHWPNFFVAGYKFEKTLDILEDGALRIRGKPWRILRYGKMVVPVFLRNVSEDSAARATSSEAPLVYDQHIVRIAAYCHLLELSSGLRVPYGVILTRGELTGVALPNTLETRERFESIREEARRTMRDLEAQPHMFPSVNERHCSGCPHGRPAALRVRFPFRATGKRAKQGELAIHTASVASNGAKDRESPRRYHSHCGDRFRWLPPHQLTMAMELEED